MRVSTPLALLLGLVLAACAAKDPDPAPLPAGMPALGPEVRIASVEVAIDRDGVSPSGIASLEKYEIAEKVRAAVGEALGPRRGQHGEGDLVLHIEIDHFRLRSGGSAFWLGAMGGADSIKVTVEVLRGDSPIKSYATDTSTVLGGIAYASPTRRSNRLVKTISERIVAGL